LAGRHDHETQHKVSDAPRGNAYWRPIVLEGLRSRDPAGRISAMERIRTGYVHVDDVIEANLHEALEDQGVHTFQARDWDDLGDDDRPRLVTRSRRVADEAVKLLAHASRRQRCVARIEERIAALGEEASESLYRALGELAPSSVERLLRDAVHASERVRGWARAALARAIHWSTPAQHFAILDVAISRLGILSEADHWLRLLEHAHDAFSPNGLPAVRDHVVSAGPDHATILSWLGSEVRSVRAIAISVLAHRALDPRARSAVAHQIAAELPGHREAPIERDAGRHRRETLAELAIHVLAVAVPEALTALRNERPDVRAALSDYARFELERPDGEGLEGTPWFVGLALAKKLTDEPDIVEALRLRTAPRSGR
jgi:hypothetical protein